MELVTGIGPVTPTLPRWCSTAEPHQQMLFFDWILRLNLVIKKCCFYYTKAVLYRWATVANHAKYDAIINYKQGFVKKKNVT